VLPAIAVALVAVVSLPRWCAARSWRSVVTRATAAALAWGVSLALVDGRAGLAGPAQGRREYLAGVARIASPARFLREFPDNILDFPVHVQGHPPGYPIVVWVIDRLGLGAWGVSWLQIVGGVLVVPAVLVAVRAVGGEGFARAAAPFVAVSPAAIWLVSSADAFFAGVGAWGVTCVVLAFVSPRRPTATALAVAGGVLLGVTAFLSYGLVLLALIPLGVAAQRRTARPIALATLGGLLVVGAFALAGFLWVDGLAATRGRYFDGIASRRPYEAFLVANLACVAIVAGPAVAVGLARLGDVHVWALVGGALAAVLVADFSGMSKGEVERIWLPFTVWLLPACGTLVMGSCPRARRTWLALQCGVALLVQVTVRTPW
jgi:hypothetical protein